MGGLVVYHQAPLREGWPAYLVCWFCVSTMVVWALLNPPSRWPELLDSDLIHFDPPREGPISTARVCPALTSGPTEASPLATHTSTHELLLALVPRYSSGSFRVSASEYTFRLALGRASSRFLTRLGLKVLPPAGVKRRAHWGCHVPARALPLVLVPNTAPPQKGGVTV